ncbi:MAG: carbon-nitrogen hydrolase family protein [Gammaproteobacteria bacterium]|nr:carbon-nitrogen hydrolase family protein [Gammaproteobacteria bacterium]
MSKSSVIQMTSGATVEANLAEADRLISDAARSGSQLVVLPENFALMGMDEYAKLSHMEDNSQGPIHHFLAEVSRRNSIWIVAGTMPMASSYATKIRAACLIYNDRGEQIARYDKMHLFDVDVPDSDEQYCESDTIDAGQDLLILDSPVGKLGVAVCYDLRFPEMFRIMLEAGMEVLALPAAFTAATGAAHWEILLRARAIENLCYVIASNQGGVHENGRKTYGHSMIIDPWGKLLNSIATGPGIISADIDLNHLHSVRHSFPAIKNRRFIQEFNDHG